VALECSLLIGLAGILVFSCEKGGRLKSSRSRVIAAASEKIKKVTLLILRRAITVDEIC
jgi:hypothetical protein